MVITIRITKWKSKAWSALYNWASFYQCGYIFFHLSEDTLFAQVWLTALQLTFASSLKWPFAITEPQWKNYPTMTFGAFTWSTKLHYLFPSLWVYLHRLRVAKMFIHCKCYSLWISHHPAFCYLLGGDNRTDIFRQTSILNYRIQLDDLTNKLLISFGQFWGGKK